ncbi:MAG: hypothetical protein JSS66_09500 [Armatimonadetes bacterium]|nr:hypothetical protein [Armatimonadota bacterium]
MSMIRIVGVQKSPNIGQEFVLLQNQGSMRVSLRGHAVVADTVLTDPNASPAIHLFSDDEFIFPGQYVLLRTCPGGAHWTMTSEGHRVFHTSMGRLGPVWDKVSGPIHVLAPQHTYCERTAEVLAV